MSSNERPDTVQWLTAQGWRVRSATMRALASEQGGYQYGAVLGYTGSAVLFCLLGATAAVALSATAPVRDRAAAAGLAGVVATAAWMTLVVPAGVLGEMLLAAATIHL